MILKEIAEIRKIFGNRVSISLTSLNKLKFIVLNWGSRKVYRLPRSRFKYSNIDKPFEKYYPLTALEAEFMDYHQRYGNRVGVVTRSYNKLQLKYFNDPSIMRNNDDFSSVNSDISKSLSLSGSNGYDNNRKYNRKRGRKKRQYRMVYKNNLQNVKFKQFGEFCNDYYGNNVVAPKLVTARAPLCAQLLNK